MQVRQGLRALQKFLIVFSRRWLGRNVMGRNAMGRNVMGRRIMTSRDARSTGWLRTPAGMRDSSGDAGRQSSFRDCGQDESFAGRLQEGFNAHRDGIDRYEDSKNRP